MTPSPNATVFTEAQLDTLRAAYAPLERIPAESAVKLSALVARASDDNLRQIAKADVKFVSVVARNECGRRGLPVEKEGF